MRKICLSLVGLILALSVLLGQELDWEQTDIDGNTHHFFEELTPNRVGILFFGTTWSTTSWTAHNSGVLEELYQIYGPDGEDILRVYFLESDQTTSLEDILGTGDNTTGDWTAAVSYPIFNLVNGQIPSEYNISSTPTITLVDTAKMKVIHNLWGANYNVDFISTIIESYKVQSALKEDHLTNHILVYPNPAKDIIYVTYPTNEINSVQVHNSIGRQIYFDNTKLSKSWVAIDISNWLPGVYILNVQNGTGRMTKSFVKL